MHSTVYPSITTQKDYSYIAVNSLKKAKTFSLTSVYRDTGQTNKPTFSSLLMEYKIFCK